MTLHALFIGMMTKKYRSREIVKMLILMEEIMCPDEKCWNAAGNKHRLHLLGVSVDRWNVDEIQVVFTYKCIGLHPKEYTTFHRGKSGPVKFEDVRKTLKRVV